MWWILHEFWERPRNSNSAISFCLLLSCLGTNLGSKTAMAQALASGRLFIKFIDFTLPCKGTKKRTKKPIRKICEKFHGLSTIFGEIGKIQSSPWFPSNPYRDCVSIRTPRPLSPTVWAIDASSSGFPTSPRHAQDQKNVQKDRCIISVQKVIGWPRFLLKMERSKYRVVDLGRTGEATWDPSSS